MNSLPLRIRLSIVMVLAILLVSVVLIYFSNSIYSLKDAEFQDTYITSESNLLSAVIDQAQSEMGTNFRVFTRDRKLKTALFREKFEDIGELLGPVATRLTAEGTINNMAVISKDGKVVFSALSSSQNAGTTALAALQSGKNTTGLDLTTDGRLVMAHAIPILDRADLVGIGVFERELDGTLQKIRETNGHELVLYDNSGVLQASTLEQPPAELANLSPASAEYEEKSFGSITWGMASIPLANTNGDTIAYLHGLKDITIAADQRSTYILVEIIIGLAILLLAAYGTYWYVNRSLKPLGRAINIVERVASGDLSVAEENNYRDEFGRLLDAVQKMNEDLRDIVESVSQSVEAVLDTVNEVRSSSKRTNEDVSSQNASLQNLSAALTQLTTTANQVTDNISELQSSTEASSRATAEGDKIVKQSVRDVTGLVESMRQGGDAVRNLESKSQEIGVVLEVIKSIAEQTNLLALNAAIEAARAGEMGRGFAVVADEVRTLAARTQESTVEIEDSIKAVQEGVVHAVDVMNTSIEQANHFSDQASTISDALDDIDQQTTTISGLSTDVHHAAEQQRLATEDMNSNIMSISDVADSTAQHVQGLSASVDQLQEISKQLQQRMKHFKL